MTDSVIRVRDATSADAESISALLAELGHPVDAAAIPSRLAAVSSDGGATLVVVDADDAPIGLMSLARFNALTLGAPNAYITALVTSNAARRRGVGQLLVRAAREWATHHGCERLTVTSAERRADAHAFYPACGLPYTGRRFATPLPLAAR
jgi:GNAT superfamily N-acetyltransferase